MLGVFDFSKIMCYVVDTQHLTPRPFTKTTENSNETISVVFS